MQNIGASNAGDEFYRYKMPSLQSKIEGRGNGIKTNVMNMVDVAKALGRPASYTTKFFGCELGAQTKFEEASGLAIVNGAHDTQRLSQHLEVFIKKFVQCGQCGNPETDIIITKKEDIELKCKACGALTKVDMRHKLCTFIIKNPPAVKDKSSKLRRAEKERMKEGEAIDKAEKEKKKEKKEKKEKGKDKEKEKKPKKEKKKGDDADAEEKDEQSSGESAGDDDDDDDDGVAWSVDTSAAAAAQRAKEQLSENAASMVSTLTVEEAAAAASKAAAAPPKATSGKGASGKGSSADDASSSGDDDEEEDEDADELVVELRRFAKRHSAKESAEKLAEMQTENLEHKMHILVNALLDPKAPLKTQFEKKADFFRAAAKEAAAQGALMAAFELFLSDEGAEQVKTLAVVLQVMYDKDIIEEDTLCAWYDNPTAAKKFGVSTDDAKAIREKSAKFIEWLRTAESDEEDD